MHGSMWRREETRPVGNAAQPGASRRPSRAPRARAGACSVTRATAPERLLPARVRRSASAFGPLPQSAPASHPSSCQSATPGRSVAAARWATTRRSRDWRFGGAWQRADRLSLSFPGVIASLAGGLWWSSDLAPFRAWTASTWRRPVDQLLDVAVERSGVDQLEVKVGRTSEDCSCPL